MDSCDEDELVVDEEYVGDTAGGVGSGVGGVGVCGGLCKTVCTVYFVCLIFFFFVVCLSFGWVGVCTGGGTSTVRGVFCSGFWLSVFCFFFWLFVFCFFFGLFVTSCTSESRPSGKDGVGSAIEVGSIGCVGGESSGGV